MATRHRSPLEPVGLALLAVMPLAYLGMLIWASPGRDLDLALLVGSAAFLGVGLGLLVMGLWQGRSGRARVGLVVLATAVFGPSLLVCGGFWYGSKTRQLTVRVRDAQTGRPLANASVCLSRSQASPDRGTEGKTDANGVACLTHEFRASGTRSVVCNTGGISLSRETLTVEAEGYRGIRGPLWGYVGTGWPLHDPLPVVEVRLHKK
jgi:hypothetical protein